MTVKSLFYINYPKFPLFTSNRARLKNYCLDKRPGYPILVDYLSKLGEDNDIFLVNFSEMTKHIIGSKYSAF